MNAPPIQPPSPPDSSHYPSRPHIGIGVVVWRADKVLLVKRRNPPQQGFWSLPGGKQELGETIRHTAVREVREETGLEIKPLDIITALDAISLDQQGRIEFHYTLVEVAAEAGEGEPQPLDDVTDVCWATLDEVEQLCQWPEVARVVRLSLFQRAL
jgi:ADP-ribose pyrophosphatase YjhB (NUDIX family)